VLSGRGVVGGGVCNDRKQSGGFQGGFPGWRGGWDVNRPKNAAGGAKQSKANRKRKMQTGGIPKYLIKMK